MLFDGAGRTVGPVVGLDTDTGLVAVAVEADGLLGVVWVGADVFAQNANRVVFEAAGCSGPPLLTDLSPSTGVSDSTFRPTGLVGGNTLVRATDDPPTATLVRSFLRAVPPGCRDLEDTVPAVPTVPFVDLRGFEPPFTVR
jgi:hypothetical protein